LNLVDPGNVGGEEFPIGATAAVSIVTPERFEPPRIP